MRCSKKSPDITSPVEPHLVAEGGVPYSPRDDRDPYEMLDELMIVVEVLSPCWPQRDELTVGDCFRL